MTYFVCLSSLKLYVTERVGIWTDSQNVPTAWLFKQSHWKDTHPGLNSEILVILIPISLLCVFLWSRSLCAVFAFVSAAQSRMFVLFCRSRRSFHLHLRCRLHPPGVCASDNRGFALLQEVGERFPPLCSALPHVWECVCAGTRTGCFPESRSHATSSAGFPTAPSR